MTRSHSVRSGGWSLLVAVIACVAAGAALSVLQRPDSTAIAATAAVGPIPRDALVDVGETVTVEIEVRDVTALFGADVQLSFDPTFTVVVDADAATPGVQLGLRTDLLDPDLVLRNVAENNDGTIWFAVTQLNPHRPVTGTGALADITLRGVVAGTSRITVTYAKLVRSDGSTIESGAESGRITVTISGSTATPGAGPTRRATAIRSATPTETPEPTEILATASAAPTWTPVSTGHTPVDTPAPTGTRKPTSEPTPRTVNWLPFLAQST